MSAGFEICVVGYKYSQGIEHEYFTAINLSLAGEAALWNLGVDGIVLSGDAGNSLLQHGQVVVSGTGGVVGGVRAESFVSGRVLTQCSTVSGTVTSQRGGGGVTGASTAAKLTTTALAPASASLPAVSVVGSAKAIGGNAGYDSS